MRLIPIWKLKSLTVDRVRKEYSRIRKEALRRLSVLERNDMIDYIDNVPEVTQARGQSDLDVYLELRELTNFLKNPFSSIKYVKEFERDMVKTMRDKGYYSINRENIREFNQYMKKAKGDLDGFMYDSTHASQIFDEAKRLNLDYTPDQLIEKYDYLEKNLRALREIKPVKNNKPMTQRELRSRITKWKNKNL